MGFLTFLPFLLQSKGAGLSEIGLALTMIFAGGAAGKLVCGFLGARLGVLPTVLLTEGATAAGILALLPLPIGVELALLPLIGVALNGTSSVLYGTVPDLVPADRRESAFGVFYTGTIGAGALSPVLYGLFSDAIGLPGDAAYRRDCSANSPLGMETDPRAQRGRARPQIANCKGSSLTKYSPGSPRGRMTMLPIRKL